MNNEQYSFAEKMAMKAVNLTAFSAINLCSIKDKIQTLLGLIGRNGIFDEYTKHDISHINGMLMSLDYIVPAKVKEQLTSADWLLIVLSIYFHDLGMLVTKQEYENRNQSKEFQKFKGKYLDSVYNLSSIASLNSEQQERFVFQEYVRKHHGERISNWILDENSPFVSYDSNVTETIAELVKDLPPLFKVDLAKVCASHSLDDLDDFEKYKVSQSYGTTPQEKANVFYVALILRTADLLHITQDRTPIIEYRIIAPTNPISQDEWAKQKAVASVTPKIPIDEDGNKCPDMPSDTFEVNAYFENERGFFSLIEYLNYVRVQLKNSYRINEIARKKYASSYDFPWKDIDDSSIQTKNFERKQLSFTIDQNKVLSLLVGETLYNNLSVSLRELAQNAIDAVKVRNYELHTTLTSVENESYSPKIKVVWDEESRELIIMDNGTGMNLDIIENHLLKVGSSRYQDPDFQKKHPGYNSISRFGIGLLTCFLIADDVDILTTMNAEDKPLLLKIRNVHGKYLLKHGVEKNSNLRLLEEVGTSIKLKVRPDVKNFNPVEILRYWIIIPQCEFIFSNGEEDCKIGYDSPNSLLRTLIESVIPQTDRSNYKVVEYNDEGIDLCVLLKYNSLFREWSMVDIANWIDLSRYPIVPTGISIEGIRIDSNTPGFSSKRFIAFANMTGEKAPKTNVARSNINSDNLEKTLETIYALYLKNISDEREKLCKDFSITWAAEESDWLLTNFLSRRNLGANAEFSNKDILIKKLCEIPTILIEKNDERQFISIDELKINGHYWTIESEAFDSANRLLKEIKSNKSVVSILTELYNSENANMENIDILLNKKRFYNLIDDILLSEFQISNINVVSEQRRLDLCWSKISSEKNWLRLPKKRNMHNDAEACFIQLKRMNFNSTLTFDGIKSTYGIILLYDSPITQFLGEATKVLNLNNEDDVAVLSDLCYLIQLALTNKIRKADWQQQIEKVFDKRNNPQYHEFVFSKISMNKLIEACANTEFRMYDASQWYRTIDAYPWEVQYW